MKRTAFRIGLAALVALAPLASAATVYYQTNFNNYIAGPLCTANPTQGWQCGSTGLTEGVNILYAGTNGYLYIVSVDEDGGTPYARHAVTTDADLQVRVNMTFALAATDPDAQGTEWYSVISLKDTQNLAMLYVGFHDQDRYLDYSSGNGVTETSFFVPEDIAEVRNYRVLFSPGNDTYRLKVLNGASEILDVSAIAIRTGTNTHVGYVEFGTRQDFSTQAGKFDDLCVSDSPPPDNC